MVFAISIQPTRALHASRTLGAVTPINRQYTREMRRHFGYSATWIPTVEVRLGDVGLLMNDEYVRVGSLAEFGIGFSERADSATGTLEYTSAGSVSIEFNGRGEIPSPTSSGKVGSGILLTFGAENSIFFSARNCTTISIEEQGDLRRKLLSLVRAKRWLDHYVVVTEVIRSERTTILGSSAAGARIELSADASAEVQGASLLGASTQLRIKNARNIALQIVAEGGLTPLFRAWGVSQRPFRSPQLVQRSLRKPPVYFTEVDYESYAE